MNIETAKSLLRIWAQREAEIAKLQEENKALKVEIEEFVLENNEPLYLDNGETPHVIITSKGEYNWEAIAKHFEPDDDVILKWTETRWNKVAEDVCPDKKALEPVKKVYYTPGIPFAQCRLK